MRCSSSVGVLAFDFRTLRHTLLALAPLAVGSLLTLGAMGFLGVALNPANMIALPLIVGVGVDNGVHVVHDFVARRTSGRYALARTTGVGIAVAALTTVLGFGSLMTATHRGFASLGLVLALGVTFCMIAALVLLPAILSLGGSRIAEPKPLRRGRLGRSSPIRQHDQHEIISAVHDSGRRRIGFLANHAKNQADRNTLHRPSQLYCSA